MRLTLLEGGVKFYRILASKFTHQLMRFDSFPLTTGTRDRPATHRLPVWLSPWHGWRIISSRPLMGMFLVNLDYLPIPVSEETLERRVARRAETVFANFLVWVFSPPRLVALLAPRGLGFSPFALEVTIRTRMHLTTLGSRARVICMHVRIWLKYASR
mgnify:CR=1 FL=1